MHAERDPYEAAMLAAFQRAKDSGVRGIVFGDIYLEDLRRYREVLLARAGLQGIFPLWGRGSRELVLQIIDAGIRSTVVCVDSNRLDRSFCGRELDQLLHLSDAFARRQEADGRRKCTPSTAGNPAATPLADWRAGTEPDVNLSIHTARATARRLPPSIDHRVRPVAG